MSGFLAEMERSSRERVAQAMRQESAEEIERRARSAPPAPPLRCSPEGFDVIAELKLTSPAAGVLQRPDHDWLGRVTGYARAGAAAVSVLTEPSRFDGSLEHLRRAASALAPLGVPAMRKDFIIDRYQLFEARAAGAGGVLLIVRMLRGERIVELLKLALDLGLFVLLEAFDEADLLRTRELLEHRARGGPSPSREPAVLVGINCRDLDTLEVLPARFAQLAPLLPESSIAVAESGVATAADARNVRKLGYRMALIGTALMRGDDPGRLLSEIFASTCTKST
ncbi:MAG TPA: indole-3-glycerol-phosphate synthase [Steroidobacteraceae bacterium]|nr:indole-3-glycerol-phosphate synthase [Steroidobacteraceae bacterium]